jgi:hypothetical protein
MNSKAGLTLSVIGMVAVLMLVLAPLAVNHQTFGQPDMLLQVLNPHPPANLKQGTTIPQSTSKSSSGPSSSGGTSGPSSSGGTSGPSSSSSSSGGTSSPSSSSGTGGPSGTSSSGGTSGPSSMHVTHVTVHHHKKHKGGHSGVGLSTTTVAS